MPTLSFLPEI